MKPLKIEVTQEDINNGRPSDCHRCPVANAAYRLMPRSLTVWGTGSITFYSGGSLEPIPEDRSRVVSFIRDFDDNKPVSPMSFEVDYLNLEEE